MYIGGRGRGTREFGFDDNGVAVTAVEEDVNLKAGSYKDLIAVLGIGCHLMQSYDISMIARLVSHAFMHTLIRHWPLQMGIRPSSSFAAHL